MTQEERDTIHRMDKTMAELAVMLKSQSENILVIFANQEKRESETKEILKSLSSSMEKGRGLSDRVAVVSERVDRLEKSRINTEKGIVVLESELAHMKLFNKRIIGAVVAACSGMAYFIFQITTSRAIG